MKKEKEYQRITRIPVKYIPIMGLAVLSINILSLALPITMKQIYTRVITNKSAETLFVLIMGCFIALLFEALLRYIKEISGKWIASKYEHHLSSFLIKKILSSYPDERSASNYNANLEKFNTLSRVTSFYSTSVYQLYIDLPFMFLFLYLVYYFGGALVLIPILISTLYIVFMLFNASRYLKFRGEQISSGDFLLQNLTETLEKIHLVKAAGLEEFQIAKYKKALDHTTEASFKTGKYLMTPEIISPIYSQITMFSILIGGGFLMLNGQLNFGEITACALLGARAISPVQILMDLTLQRKDIRILRERIEQIVELKEQYKPEAPIFPEDITGMVEIMDLEYQDIRTLRDERVSIEIKPGNLLCINPLSFLSYRAILNRLLGREPIRAGRILIDNLDISEWNMSELKGKIEYVTENCSIYKGSVLDNITYFNNSRNIDAYEAAALTGLDILVSELSDGFETMLDSQFVNYLSSAFMQRLSLTRALIVRPRILIIDRIDESMDKESFRVYLWLLEKFKGKITMIIVTGNSNIHRIADSVLGDEVESDSVNA